MVYEVTAVNASGESLPGGATTLVTTAGTGHASCTLNTSGLDVPGATSYNIYLSLDSGDFGYIGTVQAGQDFLDEGNVAPNGTPPTETEAIQAPIIESLSSACPDGIYQLQFNYIPACSRNDPNVGITNRVDIFCNNSRQVEATQDSTWIDTNVFNNNSGDPLNVIDFARLDGSNPTPGNYFIPFYFTPLIAASTTGQIEIGVTTYVEGTDYYTVNNITAFGMAPQSACGVEWVSEANGATQAPPTSGDAMSLDYYFNQIPTSVQIAAQNWALVTTDVMVHQAKLLWLNFYLGIVLANSSYSQATVLSQISTAIGTYLTTLSYDSVVQVSEIISLVQNVPGVMSVRMLTSADIGLTVTPVNAQADGNNYGIQAVTPPGTNGNYVLNGLNNAYALFDGSVWRAVDVPLNDDTLPALSNVYAAFMAPNTFGSV